MKPNLKDLNLNNLKGVAGKVRHIRLKISPVQWIIGVVVVAAIGVGLYFLLRPRPAAVVLPVVGVEPVVVEDVGS